MKKIILIGKSGSGKTTLTRKLMNEALDYKKTQSIEYCNNIIDTPGEYLENRSYYKALLVTSLDADAILLLQDVCDSECYFPPGYAHMFNKPTIGVITKIDMNSQNPEAAIRCLLNAGVEKIYKISAYTGEGLEDLIKYLEYL